MTFLCLFSNIPVEPVYGRYISHLMRLSWVCGYYHDYVFHRGLLLKRELLNQWFLKSSLRLLYGRHQDFVNCYGIYVSQVTTYIFCLRSTQSFPYSYLVIKLSLNSTMVKSYERALPSCMEHIRYIQSVLVQDFVSCRGCCVNQHSCESQ